MRPSKLKTKLIKIKGLKKNGSEFVSVIEAYANGLTEGRYNKCDPFLKYMETWQIKEILSYCRRNNWTAEFIEKG